MAEANRLVRLKARLATLAQRLRCACGRHTWGESAPITRTQTIQQCACCPCQRAKAHWDETWTLAAKGAEVHWPFEAQRAKQRAAGGAPCP